MNVESIWPHTKKSKNQADLANLTQHGGNHSSLLKQMMVESTGEKKTKGGKSRSANMPGSHRHRSQNAPRQV
jgi:hypothetical protein